MPRTPATPRERPNPFGINDTVRQMINVRADTGGERPLMANSYGNQDEHYFNLGGRHGATRFDEDSLDALIAVLMRYRALLGDSAPQQVTPLEETTDDEELPF